MKKILGLAVLLTLLGQPAFAQSKSKSTEAYKESMTHMHHGMRFHIRATPTSISQKA